VSDIDTAVVVDSLKVLDPEWPIREADVADAQSKRPCVAIYLANKGIPWPLLESGRLDLSDDTFRQMAKLTR
jgi:hypothetical protein